MKNSFALAALVGVALTSVASASNFSVSGAGGNIPDPAGTPGVWNSSFTGAAFTSSVTVPRNVTSITSVTLTQLAHTWRGDLHVILRAPGGTAHNIIVRPGSTGASVGDSGDYLLGNYVIVQTGGGTVAQGAANISGGTYDQFFNTGTGQWTLGIANTPMNSIAGAAGVWTLEIRDWANLDLGSLSGWTLSGTDTSTGTVTTFCDCSGTAPVGPCGNNGAPGNGCRNSINPGANLSVAGNILTVVGTQAGSTVIFLKGTPQPSAPFWDGLLCMSNLVRFGLTTANTAGVSSATDMGSGSYQAWYRDQPNSPCGTLANTTNGITY